MNTMEKIFQIRSRLKIWANDYKINIIVLWHSDNSNQITPHDTTIGISFILR